jgi:hypothetical protein
MTSTDLETVTTLGPFEPTPQAPHHGDAGTLAQAAVEAQAAARQAAATRLGAWLPAAAVARLDGYFAESEVHQAPARPAGGGPPAFVLEEFLARLCATPRAVHGAGAANAAEVELRTLDGSSDGTRFGAQTEPDAVRVLFSPARLRAALDDGLSLGVRQFDRQFPEWTPWIDDIATVAGADVFTKLFLAGGQESVTDWHRDQSDVVVTMLGGAKRFQVAPITAGDEPEVELDATLTPGTALLLPRARAHCATPTGATSALLSIGVMRQGDWAFRAVPPTHLGLASYPRSTAAYRTMLRPHLPVAPPPTAVAADQRWRSRAPGGVVVLDEDDGRITFAAIGSRHAASEPTLRVLLSVCGAGVRTTAEVADDVGLTHDDAAQRLRGLSLAELVAAC